MKKIILTLFIAAVTTVSVNAQASIGVKAGVNFASILNENISGVKGRTSFNAGIMAEIATSSTTSVQLELLYSGQGFSYDGGTIGADIIPKDTYKLNYLNIPILFKYYINDEFSFAIGPQLGFLVSSKTENTDKNLNDYFTTASFDVVFGLGYKFDNGLYFDARYNLGLTDIYKGPTVDYPTYPYYYYYDYGRANGVFQLSMGFYFN
jgi:hypothetical protein